MLKLWLYNNSGVLLFPYCKNIKLPERVFDFRIVNYKSQIEQPLSPQLQGPKSVIPNEMRLNTFLIIKNKTQQITTPKNHILLFLFLN